MGVGLDAPPLLVVGSFGAVVQAGGVSLVAFLHVYVCRTNPFKQLNT